MSDQSNNPYAPPVNQPKMESVDGATMNKLRAIIKDANQFWIAMLLCFLCSALAVIGVIT